MNAQAHPSTSVPVIVVVMGVSGSGKSTLAQALAERLGWAFLEGDALHAPESIARMHAGLPLDDARRGPWLDAVAAWIDARVREGRSAVVACSALRRRYRRRLREGGGDVRFAYLRVPRAVLAQRLGVRKHFMPASLLESQLATLEEPGRDEPAITLDGERPVAEAVQVVVGWIAARRGDGPTPGWNDRPGV